MTDAKERKSLLSDYYYFYFYQVPKSSESELLSQRNSKTSTAVDFLRVRTQKKVVDFRPFQPNDFAISRSLSNLAALPLLHHPTTPCTPPPPPPVMPTTAQRISIIDT